jgi:hypothetical protein
VKKEISRKYVFLFMFLLSLTSSAYSVTPILGFDTGEVNIPIGLIDVTDRRITLPFGKGIGEIDITKFKFFKDGTTFKEGGWSSGNNAPDSSIVKELTQTFECQVRVEVNQGYDKEKALFFAPFIINNASSEISGNDLYWSKMTIKSYEHQGDLNLVLGPKDLLSLIKVKISRRGYQFSSSDYLRTSFTSGLMIGKTEISSTEHYILYQDNSDKNFIHMLSRPVETLKVNGVYLDYRAELVCIEQ